MTQDSPTPQPETTISESTTQPTKTATSSITSKTKNIQQNAPKNTKQTQQTTKTTTTATAKSSLAPTHAERMPMYLVLLSGFTTMSLLVWGLAWTVMIFLMDNTRVTTSLSQYWTLFLALSFGLIAVNLYSQYCIMTRAFYMTDKDSRILAITRLVGVFIILGIFRGLYFDALVSNTTNIQPDIVTSINDGI